MLSLFSNQYYKNFVKLNVISKHNILNSYSLNFFKSVEISVWLKGYKKEVNLLLFWVLYAVTGHRPLVLKEVGFKKKKITFKLNFNLAHYFLVSRLLSIFVFSKLENRKLFFLKNDQNLTSFSLKGINLDYFETMKFYRLLVNADLQFLFENLAVNVSFNSLLGSTGLPTVLRSFQYPVTGLLVKKK